MGVIVGDEINFHGHEEMPDVPMTLGSTLVNKTGSWKYLRPVYLNKTPPCNEACPAGNDIEAIMDLVAKNEFDAAWERLMWENPFPAITGRVCHHPCQTGCNRFRFDEPLAIQNVERFLGDHALRFQRSVKPIREPNGKHVAVVGSGPAGLAAAYHLARLGHEVTIFEARSEAGGVLRFGIPEYRLPKYILNGEIERLHKLGIKIQTDSRVGEQIELEELQSFDAVFLATGMGLSRRLNLPGEDASGVWCGLDFLDRLSKKEDVQIGERVAVIGGGNTAIDVARSALRLGKSVQILYRRTRHEMPAIEDEIEEALAEGVELHTLMNPIGIEVEKGKVVGLKMIRMQLGEPDDSGRRRPIPIDGSEFNLGIDTVIKAIGEQPDFSYLPEEFCAGSNVVSVSEVGQMQDRNIFAGGDIVDQPHTVVDAIASGKRAAMAIDRYLQGEDLAKILEEIRVGHKESLSMRRYVHDSGVEQIDNQKVVEFDKINLNYFEEEESHPSAHRQAEGRTHDFGEVNRGYTEEVVMEEAARCFHCGVCNECDNCLVFCPDFAIQRDGTAKYVVDYDYCKGCGICARECPRNAITMVPEGGSA